MGGSGMAWGGYGPYTDRLGGGSAEFWGVRRGPWRVWEEDMGGTGSWGSLVGRYGGQQPSTERYEESWGVLRGSGEVLRVLGRKIWGVQSSGGLWVVLSRGT